MDNLSDDVFYLSTSDLLARLGRGGGIIKSINNKNKFILKERQVQVAEKTKVSFNVKIFALVSLLVGVGLGGYLLNMAGAAIRCSSNSCTVISRLTAVHKDIVAKISMSESKWIYVYGPDKNSEKDLSNLIGYVNNGADVKVIGLTNGVGTPPDSGGGVSWYASVQGDIINCEGVNAGTSLACTSLPTLLISGEKGESRYEKFVRIGVGQDNTCLVFAKDINQEIDYRSLQRCNGSSGKWYIRK